MKEFLEIIAAVLAVFGIYCILDMVKVRILYPKHVRKLIRAAVVVSDKKQLCQAASYAAYLRKEQKISDERLIILANDDIIVEDRAENPPGDIYRYNKM